MREVKLRCDGIWPPALPFFMLILLIPACSPSVAPFSETAYQQAVELKVDSMELMAKATESFEDHKSEVAEIRHNMLVAYEYADGRPDNELSTQQWEIMKDPDRNLFGGFLARWGEEDSLNETFIEEASKLVREAFDNIIGLESGKVSPDDI